MVRLKTTPRKTVFPIARPPPPVYRLYHRYMHTPHQGLDDYVRDLSHMRDRVLRTGHRVFDYEMSIHLLQTVYPGVRNLAQRVFDDFLELDLFGR